MVRTYPVVYVAFLALLLVACAPQQQTDPLELMLQADATITAGAEALIDAAGKGIVPKGSDTYERIADGLRRASSVMDEAWTAYRAGLTGQALDLRLSALQVYASVRPMLVQAVGEID